MTSLPTWVLGGDPGKGDCEPCACFGSTTAIAEVFSRIDPRARSVVFVLPRLPSRGPIPTYFCKNLLPATTLARHQEFVSPVILFGRSPIVLARRTLHTTKQTLFSSFLLPAVAMQSLQGKKQLHCGQGRFDVVDLPPIPSTGAMDPSSVLFRRIFPARRSGPPQPADIF